MISICGDPPSDERRLSLRSIFPLNSSRFHIHRQQICHSFAMSLPTWGPITIVSQPKIIVYLRLDLDPRKVTKQWKNNHLNIFFLIFPIEKWWFSIAMLLFLRSDLVSPVSAVFPHHQSFQGFLRISTGSKHQAMQGITSGVSLNQLFGNDGFQTLVKSINLKFPTISRIQQP